VPALPASDIVWVAWTTAAFASPARNDQVTLASAFGSSGHHFPPQARVVEPNGSVATEVPSQSDVR
jgi:hypothetical protein